MTEKTVLIADDDWDLADALSARARALGLKAQTVHSGLATLHFLQERAVDLIILDVNMPAGDGMMVCEKMASDPDLARIPVLILTGRKDLKIIQRCHQMGAYYLPKSPHVWQQIKPLLVELLDVGSHSTRAATVN
jgi:CheY-like chemotaxis protein